MKRMFSQSPILDKNLNSLLIYSIPKLVDRVDLASMASQEQSRRHRSHPMVQEPITRTDLADQLTSRTHRRPRSHDVGVRWIARDTVTRIFEERSESQYICPSRPLTQT